MRFSAKTLAELRTGARELADMVTSAPSTHFITDENLDRRINEARLELFDLILTAYGHEDYAARVDLETVVAQETYDLPRDFHSLLAASVAASTSGPWRRLDPYNFAGLATLRNLQGSLERYHYRLRNQTLSLMPLPATAGHVVRIDYVAAPAELIGEADIYDRGWPKWLMLKVAEDLATAEENYELAQVRNGQRKEIEQRLVKIAGERDAARPYRIEDTRGDAWWGGWSSPPADGEVF